MPLLKPQKNTDKCKPLKSLSLSAASRVERMKYYTSRQWSKLRKAKLIDSPLCEVCLNKGRITPAEHIHHIISPFKVPEGSDRATLFYDYNNLCSICAECHGRIHRKK